ncbi:MAG: hypothetical protein GX967_03775 [Clostridiales bacterium]|nr:hypothetical protein [Clostridiales bacterium]
MRISEKVSYLKGLIEGLGINEDTNEGKIYNSIIDILGDIAGSIDNLEEETTDIVDLIDIIDEDLGILEEEVYDIDDEDLFDFDDELYEVICPSCEEEIILDPQSFDDGEMLCPSCGQHLEFDFDDCGCDECECHHDEE